MRSNLLLGSTLALAASVAMWSCGGNGSATAPSSPAPATPTTATINIVGSSGNAAFTPNPIQSSVGNMIVWTNKTSSTHHIVLDDGSVVGDIAAGASSAPLQLKSTGGNYHCTIHSTMIGSINGASAPQPPPCTTPGYC
jgi:plastocyanin